MKMLDKVVIITGAAAGYKTGGPSIGSAIALKFAAEGAKVVVVDIREKMGELTAQKIQEAGGKGLFVKADVSKTEDVKKAIKITKQEF